MTHAADAEHPCALCGNRAAVPGTSWCREDARAILGEKAAVYVPGDPCPAPRRAPRRLRVSLIMCGACGRRGHRTTRCEARA